MAVPHVPNRPPRRCSAIGCPTFVTVQSRCAFHRQQAQRQSDVRRGTAQERGYTYRWSQTSQQHLKFYPLCGMRSPDAYTDGWRGECHDLGRMRAATCTDHIHPHKGNATVFWDPRNRQSLCGRCNTLKAIRFEGSFGRSNGGDKAVEPLQVTCPKPLGMASFHTSTFPATPDEADRG